MDTPLLDTDLPVPSRIVAGIDRARRQIAATGALWLGAERVELAETARLVIAGEDRPDTGTLPADARSTAAKTALEANTLVASDVDAFDDPAAYVEMVGVVARTVAIDTTARGVGAPLVSLPAATNDRPTGHIDPAAKRRSAFVPTVGAAGPTTALSLVPSEDAAQADLHGALYLSYVEMGDLVIHKGLPRWQLELVAARTSLINDCFF